MKYPAGRQVFANRLRQLRKDRGWSQQALADVADIAKKSIYRMETAQMSPTLDMLIALSRALALEVRDLVDDPAITQSDPEIWP